jgi:hypothetical protein
VTFDFGPVALSEVEPGDAREHHQSKGLIHDQDVNNRGTADAQIARRGVSITTAFA